MTFLESYTEYLFHLPWRKPILDPDNYKFVDDPNLKVMAIYDLTHRLPTFLYDYKHLADKHADKLYDEYTLAVQTHFGLSFDKSNWDFLDRLPRKNEVYEGMQQYGKQ